MQKKREEEENKGHDVNTSEGQESRDKSHDDGEEKEVVEDKNEVENEEQVVEAEKKRTKKKDDEHVAKGEGDGQTQNETKIDKPEHGIEKENKM